MRLRIRGADLVTPQDTIERGTLELRGGRILSAGPGAAGASPDRSVDAEGLTAFPGLVNAHDHLVGTWSPRAGPGPHRNVYEWLAVYFPGPVRRERLRVPDPLIFRLGAYRNLLAGVATVVDHDRRRDEALYRSAPLRVFRDYGREWVLRSVTRPAEYPPWGRGIAEELREGGGDRPFVIHAAEGLDEESEGEIAALEALGGLGRRTVLIHAIALRPDGIGRIARAGAKVVWCPASNEFLYGATAEVKALLDAGVLVCLGTDSTVTGSPHLLAELKVAREAYARLFGTPIDPARLVRMVTTDAAEAHGRAGEWGVLAPGASADVLLLRRGGPDPHARLVDAEPGDIDLLLVEGVPVLGDPRHEALFREAGGSYARIRTAEGEKLAAGDLPGLLREIRAILGHEKAFHFLPEGL